MKRKHLIEIFWALWPLIVISLLSVNSVNVNIDIDVNVNVNVEECE